MRVGRAFASNRVTGPIPDFPCVRAVQNSSAVLPTGVTAPAPVMTTRRASTRLSVARPLLVLFDIADGVPDGRDLLRVLVRNLEIELFLEGHHELDGVEGVRPEVLDELRGRQHLVLFHSELLDDDLLDPLLDRLRHALPS